MNFTKLSFATWMLVIAAPCFASQDSVKVVKGQVSDYYIPVVNEYELTGIVTDEHDQPLEGATVMFFASPAHCNTDAAGRYTLSNLAPFFTAKKHKPPHGIIPTRRRPTPTVTR